MMKIGILLFFSYFLILSVYPCRQPTQEIDSPKKLPLRKHCNFVKMKGTPCCTFRLFLSFLGNLVAQDEKKKKKKKIITMRQKKKKKKQNNEKKIKKNKINKFLHLELMKKKKKRKYDYILFNNIKKEKKEETIFLKKKKRKEIFVTKYSITTIF